MKLMKHLVVFGAAVCVVVASVGPASAQQPASKSKYVIGMSQCNLNEPWRVQMNKDIATAAKAHPEFQMIYKDAQNDSLTQANQIGEYVEQKVDLIIVSPKEAAPLTRPVSNAFKAGIPVIVLDRAVLSEDYTVFIGANNRQIGEAAGKYAVKLLGGKGNVVELKGLMTSTPGIDRHAGFMKGIAGSNLNIIFNADMQWLEPNARKEMESALARFPKIDLVFSHNDPGAHGAWLAAKAAGREKQIKFIGIDGLPQEGQAYVSKGILDATFQYPTGGQEAIDYAWDILHGKKVPKKVTLKSRIFTKENVAKGGEVLP